MRSERVTRHLSLHHDKFIHAHEKNTKKEAFPSPMRDDDWIGFGDTDPSIAGPQKMPRGRAIQSSDGEGGEPVRPCHAEPDAWQQFHEPSARVVCQAKHAQASEHGSAGLLAQELEQFVDQGVGSPKNGFACLLMSELAQTDVTGHGQMRKRAIQTLRFGLGPQATDRRRELVDSSISTGRNQDQCCHSPQGHLIMGVLGALVTKPIAEPIAHHQETGPDAGK